MHLFFSPAYRVTTENTEQTTPIPEREMGFGTVAELQTTLEN